MQRSKQSSGSMTEGVIWKQLLMFFFPLLLGTFFQQLYNTVDAMIVGKAVGKEALAAVGGATGNLISLLVGFFVGISSGATVIISQYYGARRDGDVSRAVHTAACISLIFGGGLTVLGLMLSPMLLSWMQTPETVMPHATAYLRIYFLGMIPQMLYNMGSGILRAIGDSRRPLFFLIAACMTNIVLDVITVIGMDLGVQGAAWATILSQTVSAVLVLITLMRSSASYHLSLRRLRIHPNMMTKIIRIGLPAGLQSVMYSISNVLIQTAINGFDTDVLAGWTVGFLAVAFLSFLRKKVQSETIRSLILLGMALPGIFWCSSHDYFAALGGLIGMTIVFPYEKKHVNFRDTRSLPVMILRVVGAMIVYLVLDKLLKLPFSREWMNGTTLGANLFRTARYAVTLFVLFGIYPYSFPLMDRLEKK